MWVFIHDCLLGLSTHILKYIDIDIDDCHDKIKFFIPMDFLKKNKKKSKYLFVKIVWSFSISLLFNLSFVSTYLVFLFLLFLLFFLSFCSLQQYFVCFIWWYVRVNRVILFSHMHWHLKLVILSHFDVPTEVVVIRQRTNIKDIRNKRTFHHVVELKVLAFGHN